MSTQDPSNDPSPSTRPVERRGQITFDRIKPLFGMMLSFLTLYAGLFAMWVFWKDVQERRITNSSDEVITVVGAIFILMILYIGVRISVATLSARKDVIMEHDRALLEPLIQSANEKAIEQYVRISSLSGATGTATKLGLSGLPLITVAVTLLFSIFELYKPGGGFMDLAKLTLGAFIGSFVQRSATTQAVAVTGKLPSA